MYKTYAEALQWINELVSFGIKPGLDRMDFFMEKLSHPHRRLKFIHIAGTNGKGSTCAMISKVLDQSGYQVGTFTSPYIAKFTDRIQCCGKQIPESDFLRIVNQIKPIADELTASELGSPTSFEISTVVAIVYFARVVYCDYVVWETGLGGRLDCTNIVHPVVSVITNVGHDHMEILGDSLASVAGEKAGIIKSGVPVVSAVEQLEVKDVIIAAAKEKNSTLYLLGHQFSFDILSSLENKQAFCFKGPFRQIEKVEISLNGAHQFKNAAVAIMTLEVLRQYYAAIIDDQDLNAAMREVFWAGRLEMAAHSPRILLDGAHNPEGAQSLAAALTDTYQYRKVHLLLGMLSTKNHRRYLLHILPLVDTLIITEPDFSRKMEAKSLKHIVDNMLEDNKFEVQIIVEPSWRQALMCLKNVTEEEDLAVVAGTLYLISDVRAAILQLPHSEKGW